MLKIVGCLVGVLVGLAVLSGVVLALLGRAQAQVDVAVAGCDGVSVVYERIGDRWSVAARTAQCHLPDPAALASERTSFDTLGAAVWRMPGPPLDTVALTLGRSADRPDDQTPPRTLVLTGEQAAARWGPRPVRSEAGTAAGMRAVLGDVVWSAGFGAAGLACMVAAVATVRAARRARVVAVWWR